MRRELAQSCNNGGTCAIRRKQSKRIVSAHVSGPARGARPVIAAPRCVCGEFSPQQTFRSVVSHISRKTSEMPRISCTQRWTRPRVRLSLKERRMEFAKPRNFTGNRGCGHPSFRSKRQSFDNDSRWRDVPSVRKSSYTMAGKGDYRLVISLLLAVLAAASSPATSAESCDQGGDRAGACGGSSNPCSDRARSHRARSGPRHRPGA